MITSRFGSVRVLAATCGLAGISMGGCAGSNTTSAEPDATFTSTSIAPPSSPPSKPKPDGGFRTITQEGLTFRLESLSASVQLYAGNKKGKPQVRRSISMSGNVQDPLGRRLFRVSDVELEALTDGHGHDLTTGADVQEHPPGNYEGWENIRMNRSPGSATAQSFSVQVNELDTLPARLGVLRGHVDVELVTELKTVELVAEESDDFVEPLPGVAYRVSLFNQDSSTVRFFIEYRLDRSGELGTDAPAFLGLDVRDASGNPVGLHVRPLETVLGKRIEGTLQGEFGVGRPGKLGAVRLLVATGVKPVRFDFEFDDIALTEGKRP